MKYSVEITKRYMKTVTIEVPDSVSEEDAREFASEAIDDLFDLESYQGQQEWEEDDFFDSPVKVLVKCTSDDGDEYDMDGFGKVEA